MWFTKPLTLLFVAAVFPSLVLADDPNQAPDRPRFACTVRSPTCERASALTSVNYIHGIQLSTCHERNAFSRWFKSSFTRDPHQYTFRVHCPATNDADCQKWMQEESENMEGAALRLSADARDACYPFFECYGLDKMDKNCFKKD